MTPTEPVAPMNRPSRLAAVRPAARFVDARIVNAPRAGKVRHQRHHGNSRLGCLLSAGTIRNPHVDGNDSDSHPRAHHRLAHGSNQCLRIESRYLTERDLHRSSREERSNLVDRRAGVIQKRVVAVGDQELKPIEPLARQIGGGDIAHIADLGDRVLNQRPRLRLHAGAIVEHTVYRGEALRRFLCNVVNGGTHVLSSPNVLSEF